MKRFTVFFLIFSIFMIGSAEARPYRIGMIHWIAYSPLNVADVKGLWKDQGVEVEVINFGSNQELNSTLEHKRIDIACDMMGSWVGMYMEGVPLKIVCETDWSHGGDKIIARKGLKAEDLKGRTIGVYLNQPSVTFFLYQYLKQIDSSFGDIETVELEPEVLADNFIAGRFDVIVNYDPQAFAGRARRRRPGGGHQRQLRRRHPQGPGGPGRCARVHPGSGFIKNYHRLGQSSPMVQGSRQLGGV